MNQDDQDWVDYNHGLQGTETGSMHNQLGLSDRPNTRSDNNHSQRNKQESQSKQSSKQNPRAASSSDSKGLSYLVAVIVGVASLLLLAPQVGDRIIFAYILAGIAAVIAQRYYKIILVIVIGIAGLYIYNQ